jgi:branched-chain amino acid transport system ATP-binding protein
MTSLLVSDRVSRRFGGLQALSEVSFEVRHGEILGLIGPNGAGKTTMFGTISGLVTPSSGSISYLGDDITNVPPHLRALRGIGRTFQIVQPFVHLTTLENVLIGLVAQGHSVAVSRRIAAEVLDYLGLGRRKDVPAGQLTLPEKKRLELARAFAPRPKLLLLDEVMAGLTPTEVDEMMPVLLSIRKEGATILIVEHVMRAIMSISDRIVVLANGQKIAEGLPAEIARNEQVITSYLGRSHHAAA